MPPFDKLRRQARWRGRHAGAAGVRWRRPSDRRSGPQRWRNSVAEFVALQDEHTHWFEALPEPLRETATGVALQAIIEFDLGELADLDPPRLSQYRPWQHHAHPDSRAAAWVRHSDSPYG